MPDAYKAKADVSIPRAVAELDDGSYQTEGRNYPVGSYVLADDISPDVRERVENGELDDLLEPVDGDEAKAVAALAERGEYYGTFIPEHEVEEHYQRQYGHEVVPRDQVLELKSAGSEAAAEAIAEAKEDGADERPNLTADEVPSLAEVSRGEAEAVVPSDSEHVEVPEDIEQPPGLPVGDALAKAEGAAPKKRSSRRKKKDDESSKSEGQSDS